MAIALRCRSMNKFCLCAVILFSHPVLSCTTWETWKIKDKLSMNQKISKIISVKYACNEMYKISLELANGVNLIVLSESAPVVVYINNDRC